MKKSLDIETGFVKITVLGVPFTGMSLYYGCEILLTYKVDKILKSE